MCDYVLRCVACYIVILVALLLAAVGWMVEAHHRGESFRVRLFLLDRRWLWAMFVPFAATNLRSLVSTPLHNIILMSS